MTHNTLQDEAKRIIRYAKVQYRTVDTSTLKGLKEAERLHTSGWKTASVGLFTIQFYK